MKIWIMRHGEAGFNALNDSSRSLTSVGENAAKLQGEWLGKQLIVQSIQFDKILVSPYLRAKQTLEQLLSGMQAVKFSQNFVNVVEEWDEITPDGNPNTIESYLRFLRTEGAKHILLVSHLPLVFDLTQVLTNNQANISFPTATIVEINWQENRSEVVQVKYT